MIFVVAFGVLSCCPSRYGIFLPKESAQSLPTKPCAPFAAAFIVTNPNVAGGVVGCELHVPLIIDWRNIPQIAWPIVGPIPVDVINLPLRPHSIMKGVNYLMGFDPPPQKMAVLVSVAANRRECLIAGEPRVPRFKAPEIRKHGLRASKPIHLSCFRIVGK